MNDSTITMTSQGLMKRLRKALGPRGDFPVSANVVRKINEMIDSASTTARSLDEVIRRDPTLSARILDFVNSPFYMRAEPVRDLPTAITQIGMRTLGQIVGSLILLQKFVPHARQQGPFAHSLSTSITLSTLNDQLHLLRNLHHKLPNNADRLLGTLAGIGPLLFSYYFPEIYESARDRARQKGCTLSEAIRTLSGISTTQMSLEVLGSLHLPTYYTDVITRAGTILEEWSFDQINDSGIKFDAKILAIAIVIADLLHCDATPAQFSANASELQQCSGLDGPYYQQALQDLPDLCMVAYARLDLTAPPLPSWLKSIRLTNNTAAGEATTTESNIMELRESVSTGDTLISIIGAALEILISDLGFDRVLFLSPNQSNTQLDGKLALGTLGETNWKNLSRPISDLSDRAVDKQAFLHRRLVIRGDAIFEDGWPAIAFPVGKEEKLVGVVYADMQEERNYDLTTKDHAAIAMVIDLLERAVEGQEGMRL